MKNAVTITYDILNPGKRGSAVAKTIAEEVKRIHDAIGPISGVVVNCRQSGKKREALPTFEELMDLQLPLQIGEVTVNKNYSNKKSLSPRRILDGLRRLHDEFGDQISEFEEDPKTASSALESIYAEMEIQLDALEDALDGE